MLEVSTLCTFGFPAGKADPLLSPGYLCLFSVQRQSGTALKRCLWLWELWICARVKHLNSEGNQNQDLAPVSDTPKIPSGLDGRTGTLVSQFLQGEGSGIAQHKEVSSSNFVSSARTFPHEDKAGPRPLSPAWTLAVPPPSGAFESPHCLTEVILLLTCLFFAPEAAGVAL